MSLFISGGKLRALLVGIQNASYAFKETEIKGASGSIPPIEKKLVEM